MTDLIAEDLSALTPSSFDTTADHGDASAMHRLTILPRPRLASSGVAGVARASFIHAPAGYGKTTLLDQWQAEYARQGRPALRIDARMTGAHVTQGASGRIRRRALHSHLEIVAVLANWQATSAGSIALIDNGHLLPDATLQAILDLFLDTSGAHHRVAIAMRRLPDIPLSRARALGELALLDAQDLAFTAAEVAALAACNADATAVLPEHIAAIAELADGWPLALSLCLARLIAAGGRGSTTLTAEHALIDDFIREEIVAPQPAAMRDFLIGTAPLLSIDPELCDTVLTISDSAQRIADLKQNGLLLGAPTGGLRYHRLVSRVLRMLAAETDPARIQRTSHRAVDWFEARERVREAFDQAADIEDWARAARIFDAHCVAAYSDGRGQELAGMALRIPRASLENHPRAMVYAARVASLRWRFGVVENLLRMAAEQIRSNRLGGGDPDEFNRLMLHCRMLLAQFEDNQADAERICVELLAHCSDFDHHTRGTIYGSLLYARRELFRLTDVATLESDGIREFSRCGSQYGMVLHLCIAGTVRAVTGDTAGAVRHLTAAMRVAASVEADPRIVEFPAALLAEMHYELNELDDSRDLLAQHFPCMQMGFVDQYIAAYITDARLMLAAGATADAHRRLDEAITLAETHALDRLRQHVTAERIRMLLVAGATGEALQLGGHEGLPDSADEMAPRNGCTSRDDIRARSWVRLAVARGDTAEACRLARRWLKFTADAHALRASIQWEILLAHAQASHGYDAQAQRTLRAAVSHAASGVCFRSFLDEGPRIRELLQRQHEASTISTSAVDGFVARLLGAAATPAYPAAPPAVAAAHQDLLSQREIDILQMASAGLRNVDIAKRIGLTEGSVKWYLQQIYDRIGVRRRAGAIERARELGLVK